MTRCSIEARETSDVRSHGRIAIVAAGLVIGTLLLFGRAVAFPFINLDDPAYVFEQPLIARGFSWAGVVSAFTHVHAGNWHPLTSISHMLDCQLFGLNPGGPHLVNVLLHAIAAASLFLLLVRMTGSLWRSALVSALFAWHPLRVESVAWISERKDVLSACFFFWTLLMWLQYVRRRNGTFYLLAGIFFALGLMAKPMLVTLPLLLLLLDYWPLGRFAQYSKLPLLREKLPLIFLSLASSIATLVAQRESISSIDDVSVFFRLANALDSYLVYLAKTLWPIDLALIYPYPLKFPILLTIAAVIVLSVFFVTTFRYRKRFPYLYVGWLWFVIALVPVIGLLQVGRQAYADRYTYLPHVGLFIALVWSFDALIAHHRYGRRVAWAAAVVALVALAHATFAQLANWRDPVALWIHTIDATDNNYTAHSNLADLLMRRGMVAQSLAESNESVRLNPRAGDAQNNLALALFRTGKLQEAAAHWEIAYRLKPHDRNIECNFGWFLATTVDLSLRDGARAVDLTEDLLNRGGSENPVALRAAAAARAEIGDFANAIVLVERALSLPQARNNIPLIESLELNLASYRKQLPWRDPGIQVASEQAGERLSQQVAHQ